MRGYTAHVGTANVEMEEKEMSFDPQHVCYGCFKE